MEQRAATKMVADKVTAAIVAAGVAPETVAEAADITAAELTERLAGREPFRVLELLGVGGFLRIHPAELIGQAA